MFGKLRVTGKAQRGENRSGRQNHRAKGATAVYQRILVPVDGSVAAIQGLNEAIRLAKTLGSSIKVLHVVNELILDAGFGTMQGQEQVIDALRASGKKILSGAEHTVQVQKINCESQLVEVLGGRAADVILDQAKSWHPDLIVMGTHGRRGLRRLAVGSDAELVLRGTPVPVLLVRDVSAA